jgi:hypothetical protein
MVDKSSKEAESLFEMVKYRYGDRLNAKELEEVRKGVEGIAKGKNPEISETEERRRTLLHLQTLQKGGVRDVKPCV